MSTWEQTFSSWSAGPGTAEEQRCENAVVAVRKAIAQSVALKARSIDVFVHGSYRNRVNVRAESDVDVGVVCHDTFFHELPAGTTPATFGFPPATYDYASFKNDIGSALVAYFGQPSVRRGNKAFDVTENSYRVEADVAPFFEHRRYTADGRYLLGVELHPDNGGRIINWPEQHYENGVAKNHATNRRYKRIVRILKRLSIYMCEQGSTVAENTPGLLIECLVFNVPNEYFGHPTYTADVREALAYIFNKTLKEEDCIEWGEVSELKYLFRGNQKWTVRSAHAFVDAAWNFLGLT